MLRITSLFEKSALLHPFIRGGTQGTPPRHPMGALATVNYPQFVALNHTPKATGKIMFSTPRVLYEGG